MRLFLHDDHVYLDPAPLTAAALRRNAKFKIRCRRYDEGDAPDGSMMLRTPDNFRAYTAMSDALRHTFEHMGFGLEVDSKLVNHYAEVRELAEEHYRLGNEVKRHDDKHAERFEEFAGVVNDAMVRPLKDRQMWDAFYLASMRRAGNFSVPGSGKTATVLGAFAFLADRGLVYRMLVICPKNAFDSWRTEWRACFGDKRPLVCFSSQDASFKGLSRPDRQRFIRTNVGTANLLLVNYEAAPSISDELAQLAADGTLLVFDEVHRVKRVGGVWATACLQIAQGAPATFALTGTPLPNTYEDLYNMLNIMYPREYQSFFGFDRGDLKNAGEEEQCEINERIQPFYCRTTKEDLGVPPADPDELVHVQADDDTNALFQALKSRYRGNALAFMIRLLQMESDPTLLFNELDPNEYRWLIEEDEDFGEVNDVDYSDEIVDMIHKAAARPVAKRQAVVDLVKRLVCEQGRPVIIWCILRRSMGVLTRDLARCGIEARLVYGDVVLEDRERILNDFRAGWFPVLITNPQTLAESVSLHMVCHDAVYFEYSFNLVHLLQSKDRIHRLGLAPNQRTRYYFLMQDYLNGDKQYSMDERIYERLKEKEATMMRAIESGLIEIEPTTEEDLAAIFEGLFE